MAVAFGSSASASVAALGSASIVPAKPTGTVAGDLLIAHGTDNTGATMTGDAAFTLHPNSFGGGHRLWYRVADGTEGSTFTFTRGSTAGAAVVTIVRLTGANTTTPIEAIAGASATGATSITLPTLTPTTATYLFSMVAPFSNTGWTAPATQTKDFDVASAGSSIRTAGGHDNAVLTSGVATGTRQWNFGGTNALRGYNILVNAATTSAAASLAGSGALTTDAARATSADAAVAGSGSLTAVGVRGVVAAAALAGTGSLTSGATCATSAAADLAATGTLAADASRATDTASTLAGSGTLSADTTLGHSTGTDLAATGTLSADADVVGNLDADGLVAAVGSLDADASVTVQVVVAADLAGVGDLAARIIRLVPTPPERIAATPAETRTATSTAESRTALTPAEPRVAY